MKFVLKRYTAVFVGVFLAGLSIYITAIQLGSKQYPDGGKSHGSVKEYTLKDLSEYTGSGKHQQILLAFEGNIYDVSSGSAYYAPGGAYHFLAGTDATVMLRIAGGSIVKQKYPVIGKLAL